MRIFIILTFLCCYCHAALAQFDTNRNDTTVYLLTCSPGADLYSVFGHSALLVKTPKTDWVYNYGTFDFNTDNFYLKFSRGQLPYRCSKERFGYFQIAYLQEGRQITAHALKLDNKQNQKLIELLEENVLPENAEYNYDFFYDNCATRIRDIVDAASGGSIEWNLTANGGSFRDMTDVYLKQMQWSDLGIDLALGLPCDKLVEAGEQDFLPDSLLGVLLKAELNGKELLSYEIEVIPAEPEKVKAFFWHHTFLVIALSSALLFTFLYVLRDKKAGLYLANVVLIINGLLGLLIFFLWFLTDHHATANNLNILWANPLNLCLPFIPRFKKVWLKVYALLLLLLLITWVFLPQNMHESLLPLIPVFLTAAFISGRFNSKNIV